MDGLIIGLVVAVVTLVVALSMAALGALRLLHRVRDLENQALGLHYDVGLLAIALDDAGVPIHNDTREAAYFARGGVARGVGDWTGDDRAALAGDQAALAGDQAALA